MKPYGYHQKERCLCLYGCCYYKDDNPKDRKEGTKARKKKERQKSLQEILKELEN